MNGIMFRSNVLKVTLIIAFLCLSMDDAQSSPPSPDAAVINRLSAEIERALTKRRSTEKEDVAVFVIDHGFWEADGHGNIVAEIVKKHFNGKIEIVDLEVGMTVNQEQKINAKQIVNALRYVLRYAAANPQTYLVVNISWGMHFNPLLEVVFKQFSNNDIIFVAAVGNDGEPSCFYPARYEGIIGVASVVLQEGKYVRSPYSNYGTGVDIAVLDDPHTILAAYIKSAPFYKQLSGREMREKVRKMLAVRGTSFAAPHVTGVIARMLADNTNLSAKGVLLKIQVNGDWAYNGFDGFVPVLKRTR